MAVNKDKCKDLHLGRMSPLRQSWLGLDMREQLCSEAPAHPGRQGGSLSQQSALAAGRASNTPGCVTRGTAGRWRELITPSLLGTH